MKIVIVILNFNCKEFILQCLESVRRLETGDWRLEIIVVDNASSDGSDKLVEKRYKGLPAGKAGIKILRNQENLGFSGGNNIGIQYALKNDADYVLLLNSDTIVSQDLIVQLISAQGGSASGGKVAREKEVGIVGPKIYFAPGFEFHKERYEKKDEGKVFWYAGGLIDWQNILSSHRGVDEVDRGQYDQRVETDFVSGCCLLVKKEVFKQIGLLDEKYFLYWEDVDFCERARRADFKIVYAPSAKIYHLNAGSSSVGGDLHDYYLTRNRLLFGLRYASLRTKLALLRESFKILISGRKWQKIGVFDFYRGKFGKGSYE